MIKIILVGVGAFLLAAAGSTGAMIYRQKGAAAADSSHTAHREGHDSTAHDSTAHDSSSHAGAHGDSAAGASAHADSAKEGHGAAEHAPAAAHEAPKSQKAAAKAADTADAKHGEGGPAAQAKGAAAPGEQKGDYKRLAKIFATMKAQDAVKVLGLLSDDEVEGVLHQLGAKQTADLLNNFPKERAAELSRRLLLNGGSKS